MLDKNSKLTHQKHVTSKQLCYSLIDPRLLLGYQIFFPTCLLCKVIIPLLLGTATVPSAAFKKKFYIKSVDCCPEHLRKKLDGWMGRHVISAEPSAAPSSL